MKIRQGFLSAACLFGVAALSQTASASEVLYNNTAFLTGQQSLSQALDISGPGTLTVTLSNVAWPAPLAELTVLFGTTSGLLGPQMGAGTESFQVSGGTIFAQVFGLAQGSLGVGVYSLDVSFQPSAATVPLPASLALLASGLVMLAWQRRNRDQRMTTA